MKATLLRDAIRQALIAGTVLSVALPAFAQDTADETAQAPTELDRIEVTGSRIRQVETETAQPVLTISRAQIEKQGFQSVADILQNISAAGSPALSRSSVLASGESPGGSYVDLRNLGPQRTLVLVNGKRLGINTDGLQDFASIPSAIVERVDVLKDGASSIYGSDAIAGVINIITRQNFDGAEANAYFGQFGEGDGTTQSYDFTIGSTGERSSVTLSVQYVDEDPMWAKDRSFSRFGGGPYHPEDGLTPVSQYGVLIGPDNEFYTVDRNGNPRNFGDYHPTEFPNDYANSNEQMHLRSGMERTSVYGSATFDITDNVRFVTDALYNRRETEYQVAGYPYRSDVDGGGRFPMLSIDSYYNPLGNQSGFATPQAANFFRRGWEVPRHTQNNLNTFRFTAGLEGTFEFGERYLDWNVGYLYNKNDGNQRGTGNFNLVSAAQALGPSFRDTDGVVKCGTPGNVIAGCVPWNPLASFGSGQPGSLGDPAVQNYLYYIGQASAESETKNYFANISTSIVALPAGDLAVAAGFEHREESARFTPDAFSIAGLSSDLAAGATSGGYSLDEFYVELQVPVLADMAFAKELTFDVASRYSDYSNFGQTTNSKFGLKWRPIDDLLVRGTFSEGFRAPVVSDLFGGVSETFDSYTDPCDTLFGNAATNPATAARCQAAGVPGDFRQPGQGGEPAEQPNTQSDIPFLSGSNPDLGPETATTKTLGVVYSLQFAEGLDISLDWWRIRIENVIGAESATSILNDCYVRGIESRCALFARDGDGNLTGLNRSIVNSGWLETEGYDLGVHYRLPETDFGQFTINWETTYVSYLDTKADNEADTPIEPFTGRDGNFRLRSNLGIDWTLGDFGITYGARYFSSIKEPCAYDLEGGPECNIPDFSSPATGREPTRRLGSNTFHDLQVHWNAPWNATIALGANNITDHQGPVLYNAPNSQYPYYGGFDFGRFMYMKYTQRF